MTFAKPVILSVLLKPFYSQSYTWWVHLKWYFGYPAWCFNLISLFDDLNYHHLSYKHKTLPLGATLIIIQMDHWSKKTPGATKQRLTMTQTLGKQDLCSSQPNMTWIALLQSNHKGVRLSPELISSVPHMKTRSRVRGADTQRARVTFDCAVNHLSLSPCVLLTTRPRVPRLFSNESD